MGVRGLLAYIDDKYPDTYDNNASIEQLATEYLIKEKKQPVILIDVPSCINKICDNITKAPHLTGGQLRQFIQYFFTLFRKFEDINISYVVCWDARPPMQRIETWSHRQNYKRDEYSKLLKLIQIRDFRVAEESCGRLTPSKESLTAAFHQGLRTVLRQGDFKNLKVLFASKSDPGNRLFILKYIAGCGGIFATLAGDPDFCTYEGMDRMLSISHLDLQNMSTRVYFRSRIAESFGIGDRPHHLATIGALSGNDLLPQPYLGDFHRRLIGHKNCGRHQKLLPWGLLLPKVIKWVANNAPEDCKGEKKVVQFIMENTGLAQHETLIAACLADQLLPSAGALEHQRLQADTNQQGETRDWQHIIQIAEERTKDPKHLIHYDILTILCGQPIVRSTKLEIGNLPSVHEITLPLRLRMYGILLKEKPGSVKTVTEFVQTGQNADQLVRLPEFPVKHPGLISLWDGKDMDASYRLLCWAVSDHIQVEALRRVPGQLQVPALALFLMCEAEGKTVVKWRLEALAAMAVRLMNISCNELSSLDMLAEDPRAVHMATAYTTICEELYLLADICSAPVGMHLFPPYAYYDGKLFHMIYMTLKDDGRALAEHYSGRNLQDNASHDAYRKLNNFVFQFIK